MLLHNKKNNFLTNHFLLKVEPYNFIVHKYHIINNQNYIKTYLPLNVKPYLGHQKVITRTMLSSVKAGTDAMKLAKETFSTFSEHFSKLEFPKLHNDPKVIAFFINTIDKNNYLCNRAFQLALDVTYSKSNFNRSDVLSHFEKIFSLNNNSSLTETNSLDQSTLFTMLQTKIMKNRYPSAEFTVNQTPPSNINLKDISSQMYKKLEENKFLTGNRFPDIHINGIPYDYKYIKGPCNTKNQIYLIPDISGSTELFSQYLYETILYYKQDKKMPNDFKQFILTKLKATNEAFLHAKTSEVKKEIMTNWNSFLINTANPRPPNIGIAIFEITEKPIESTKELNKELENIPLAEGRLDQLKSCEALKAIMGVYPMETRNKIYVATNGAFGQIDIQQITD